MFVCMHVRWHLVSHILTLTYTYVKKDIVDKNKCFRSLLYNNFHLLLSHFSFYFTLMYMAIHLCTCVCLCIAKFNATKWNDKRKINALSKCENWEKDLKRNVVIETLRYTDTRPYICVFVVCVSLIEWTEKYMNFAFRKCSVIYWFQVICGFIHWAFSNFSDKPCKYNVRLRYPLRILIAFRIYIV